MRSTPYEKKKRKDISLSPQSEYKREKGKSQDGVERKPTIHSVRATERGSQVTVKRHKSTQVGGAGEGRLVGSCI